MNVKWVLTTAILTIAITLSLSISNVNAILVNHTDFSTDIPDNWAYLPSTLWSSQVTSSPSEFATLLVNEQLGTLLLSNWGESLGEKNERWRSIRFV